MVGKVAIYADTSGYGLAGLADVEKALAAKNRKARVCAKCALGAKDLSNELQEARSTGAKVIFS